MATLPVETSIRFYLECDMDQPELIDVAGGHVVSWSRRCPDKEEPNDDSALVAVTAGDGLVMAVADGVGGSPMGYKASAIAVQCLAESLQTPRDTTDLRVAILDGIERANAEILDMGTGAATTISVVEIQDRVARGYQVGDSMAMILGQRGALKWKSTSHSPVGYAFESGMLDEEDAMRHEERHVVSNLVGSKSMHIEIGPALQLAARDTIVVASDGLFDNLQFGEVSRLARVGRPLDRIRRLIELAGSRMSGEQTDWPGKPDDLALLLFTP